MEKDFSTIGEDLGKALEEVDRLLSEAEWAAGWIRGMSPSVVGENAHKRACALWDDLRKLNA